MNQGVQVRSYAYDGLSRSTAATTPESGTTNFYYTTSRGALCAGDAGAVCRRTDAAGVTTTYAYDALNRLTSKTYSDTTSAAFFYYDESVVKNGSANYTITNGKGRLTHTSTQGGRVLTIQNYDLAGRVVNYWHCELSNCSNSLMRASQYTYDLAGDLATWTHPTNFTITNTISNAQRISVISSSISDANHPGTMGTFSYTAFGSLNSMTAGCAPGTCSVPATEAYDYNNRLQPVRIQVGNPSQANGVTCQVYNYYPSVSNPTACSVPPQGSGDNGNVVGYYYLDNTAHNAQNGYGQTYNYTHVASFGYDSMNRLVQSTAQPSGIGTDGHSLTFSYDRYGNMTCVSGTGFCPQVALSAATNRVSAVGGVSATHDVAGRMTSDGTYTFGWDAEGRLVSVGGNNWTATYTYNALSQMAVSNESVSGSTENLEMVYDAFGRLIGHYDVNFSSWDSKLLPRGSNSFAFYDYTGAATFSHYNALGSATTAGSDGGAFPPQESLYYPWGQVWDDYEFVPINEGDFAGMKSAGSNYWSVCNRMPWATTPCRGYNTSYGRWMSPDPDAGDTSSPQSRNRYSYANNNPVNWIDPQGLLSYAPDWPGAQRLVPQRPGGPRSSSGVPQDLLDAARLLLSDPDCAEFLKKILDGLHLPPDLDLLLHKFNGTRFIPSPPGDNFAREQGRDFTAHVHKVNADRMVHVDHPERADAPATLLHEVFHTIDYGFSDVALAKAAGDYTEPTGMTSKQGMAYASKHFSDKMNEKCKGKQKGCSSQ